MGFVATWVGTPGKDVKWRSLKGHTDEPYNQQGPLSQFLSLPHLLISSTATRKAIPARIWLHIYRNTFVICGGLQVDGSGELESRGGQRREVQPTVLKAVSSYRMSSQSDVFSGDGSAVIQLRTRCHTKCFPDTEQVLNVTGSPGSGGCSP
jgi:hypothetical protein